MKSVAILIDAGFAIKKLEPLLGRNVLPQDIIDFSTRCLKTGEELFRIYYYDCPPFEESHVHPVLVTLGHPIKKELREHSDEFRVVVFP